MSCVETYRPGTLAKRGFAFDGTVTSIGEPSSGGREVIDPYLPVTLTNTTGSRLLVSGEDRWAKSPMDSPIAWACGFTRLYNAADAQSWELTSADRTVRLPSGRYTLRGFGELEAAVMDVVWDMPAAVTVRDVREQLFEERPLAYTTVMTVMDNLYRKGMLSRVKDGRAWLYEPTASRGEYTALVMHDVLQSADDPTAAMTHFVAAMSEEESDTLRQLLRRRPGRKR
jgi:predicted transcriptional regulator